MNTLPPIDAPHAKRGLITKATGASAVWCEQHGYEAHALVETCLYPVHIAAVAA